MITTITEANPKLKIGGGGFNLEASDLPIFASLQEDSEWTPYFSVGVEFALTSWLAIEVNGSLAADVDLRTDPSTAVIPPNVRFAEPNTLYDTSLYFISTNLKYIHQINSDFLFSVFAGPAYVDAELSGSGGAFPERFSDGSLSYNVGVNLIYKLKEKHAINLSSEYLGMAEIENGVEVEGIGVKLEYVYRW